MTSTSRSLAFLLALGLSGCTEPVGTSGSQITSGTTDDVDESVVWIVAKVGGQTGYCSGVVVSPHLVLTAGHCSSLDATYAIFLGSDYNDAAAKALPENNVAVIEHHPSPNYDSAANLHDLGVLVTEAAIPRTPAALNRDPLAASDQGAAIRIVGFGQTSGTDKTIGRRHEATTTISKIDAFGLAMNGTPSFCLFDSGGPTFMTRGGTEVVVGIHSLVTSASCDATAWDARVDVDVAFVDEIIATVDPLPAPVPQTPPPASCAMSTPSGGGPSLALIVVAGLLARRSRRFRRAARSATTATQWSH